MRDFFLRERPDYVFLAAGKVGGILANNTYQAEFICENLMMEANVIHAAWRTGVAVVFPSLDEGFGIPVSEAQSLCIPVFPSRCGSLSDVAKGSIEIDPKNIHDIAEKINSINSDEELRRKCIEDGLVNVRRLFY